MRAALGGDGRRAARQKNQHLLDEPAGVHYYFSEYHRRWLALLTSAAWLFVSGGKNGRRETKDGAKPLKTNASGKRRNKTRVKSLKTNNLAKRPMLRP